MPQIDKTTRALIGLIALLLAVIAFRPYFDPAQSALAQSGSSNGVAGTVFSTQLVNRVTFTDSIVSVQVMDSKGVFLVQTKNRVEVYRVGDFPITAVPN